MGNMSKRKQPDQRAENSQRPQIGLQRSEKISHPEASFSWSLNKMCTDSVKMNVIRQTPKHINVLKSKTYKTNKGQRFLTLNRCKNASGGK